MNNFFTWIIISIIFIIIEIVTPSVFFFFCLGLGSLIAGFSTFFISSITVQVIIFCISSAFSIYFIRPFVKRFFKSEFRPSNVDMLLNKEAIVIEKIVPPNFGTVKVNGELWKAESEQLINIDEKVRIIGFKGTHLIVKKMI